MIRKLIPFMGKYKKYALLTPLCVILEVALEIFIPLLMAKIIDVGIAEGNMPYVVKTGLTMVLMAMVSLVFGALAGRFAALAAMGFARELRQALFDKVQEFSFANIDRFSTASLITRLTTDVLSLIHI